MKPTRRRKKGFTLIELLVVISIIGILAGLGLAVIPVVKARVNRLKRSNNLNQLYILMMIYSQDWNSFPTMQPPATRFDKGGGVKDLYPLYATGVLDDEALTLLQPPGTALRPLNDPDPEDFNKNTVGLSYNSTVIPDDPANPPLMADQGVSSGSLRLQSDDRGVKPIEQKGALVLFSNGTVEFVSVANKRGKLSTSKVSADEWGRLLD
jgi:prepilin-type N-terminal cleavage/methylation domain-containing protein